MPPGIAQILWLIKCLALSMGVAWPVLGMALPWGQPPPLLHLPHAQPSPLTLVDPHAFVVVARTRCTGGSKIRSRHVHSARIMEGMQHKHEPVEQKNWSSRLQILKTIYSKKPTWHPSVNGCPPLALVCGLHIIVWVSEDIGKRGQ